MGRRDPGERLPCGSAGPVLKELQYHSFLPHRFTVWSLRGEGLNDLLVDQQGAIKPGSLFICRPPSGRHVRKFSKWVTSFRKKQEVPSDQDFYLFHKRPQKQGKRIR